MLVEKQARHCLLLFCLLIMNFEWTRLQEELRLGHPVIVEMCPIYFNINKKVRLQVLNNNCVKTFMVE